MIGFLRQLLAAILSFSIAVPAFFDPVGNRKQKVSTLPGYPGGLTNYNTNDQLATDTYDANGNTTASGSTGYVYDFENHLISANGITYVYDGDGHRVSKTVNGTTTSYATTDINPTGYSQVVGESYSPEQVGGVKCRERSVAGLFLGTWLWRPCLRLHELYYLYI
jgi:YD repeat-containing protein